MLGVHPWTDKQTASDKNKILKRCMGDKSTSGRPHKTWKMTEAETLQKRNLNWDEGRDEGKKRRGGRKQWIKKTISERHCIPIHANYSQNLQIHEFVQLFIRK